MAQSSQVQPDLRTYATGFTPGRFGHIPLTTIFTPPTSCLSTITYDGTYFWKGGLLQTGDQNCYPARFTDIFNSLYSPGICPHGWTSVANPNTAGPATQSDGGLVTRAYCCPSGFYHLSTNAGYLQHACASLFGSPLTNVYSTSTRAEGPIPTNPGLITVNPKSVEANTVYADIIQIEWASTNSKILSLMAQTASVSPSATQAPAAQTAHQTIANAAETSAPVTASSSAASGGLSTGAEAGIGIGAAIGAIAIALLAYFFWRRRRQYKQGPVSDQESRQELPQMQESRYQNATMPGHYRLAHEMDPAYQQKELPEKPVELPGEVAHELPANEVQDQPPSWI